MLIDEGIDLHSYQPAVDDLIEVSECDVFIYVGGHSDQWAEDALKNASNKDMIVINLVESLGDTVKLEEIVEGMQESEHNHNHDHDHEEEHNHDHEEEHNHDHEDKSHHNHADEHVWLSLKNAKILIQEITDKLSLADPEHKDEYLANMTTYNEKLSSLDEKYQEVVDNSVNKTLLFGDRFPFRYLVDDYGLDYYAAFSGCSAETEASFETITFLSDKVDELELKYVLTIEESDGKIAETIIANTKNKAQEILTMDSLQSTTSEDVAKGATYLLVMEENLEVLEEALN